MVSRRRAMLGAAGIAVAGLAAGPAAARDAKPLRAIGVLGDRGHGKTTLTNAILKRLGPPASAPVGEAVRRVGYETDRRAYTHFDASGDPALAAAVEVGLPRMDGVILVVSAVDGPGRQAREHILLARRKEARSVVVFISKIDFIDEPELIELVEIETRELLGAHGFPGDEIPVIAGSAKAALAGRSTAIGEDRIAALIKAVDLYVP